MDFDCGGDFAALDATACFFDETSGEFAIGIEKMQAVRKAAKIAGSEAQPAAGFPSIGVGGGVGIGVGAGVETGIETGERDFVEQGEIFGKG